MLTYDDVLTEKEISFLDEVLSLATRSNKDIGTPLVLDTVKEVNDRNEEDNLETLRIKGVFEIVIKTVKSLYEYEGEERVTNVKRGIVSINKKELIRYWISTVYYRAGKGDQFNNNLLIEDKGDYFYPIDIGTETINLFFVTEEIQELKHKPNGVFVSFIGNLPLTENLYSHWWQPFQETAASHRFFDWLKESVKKSSDKKFSFINLPTDLEARDRERIYMVVRSVLEKKHFFRKNVPEYFYPESIDYLIPESTIEDCYIKNNGEEKIFLIKKSNRVEVHSFKNGEKESNRGLAESLNKLQNFLDEKVEVYRRVTERTKSSLPNTLLRYTPILITFIVSLISSLGLLLSKKNLLHSITSTDTWLIINVIVNIIALSFLSFVTIYPNMRLFFFKWERGLKKFDI